MKQIINTIHHFFLPKESNNFRAKLLHHDFLTIYLIFSLILTVGIGHIQNRSGSILGFATDISAGKLFELTNIEREKNNLAPLINNDKLAQAAENKAKDMFKNNYWAHYGPSGETPWEFILGADYQYEYAGENLAKNFLFSDGVVYAWMDSETHRENILRFEYTDVGFAIVNGILNGEETTLVVQMFGKPLNSQIQLSKKDNSSQAPVQNQLTKQINESTKVLADNNQFQFYPTYLNVNLIFLSLLLLALALDFYFASKLNLIHLKGKTLIHIFFVGFIIIGTFFIINGAIS